MTSMLRLLTTLVCAAASLAAADRISLNGEWQFRIDPDGKGAAQGWSSRVPQGVEARGGPPYLEYWSVRRPRGHRPWYFRTFLAPQARRAKPRRTTVRCNLL